MLVRNLIIGAVVGIAIGGCMAFMLLSPSIDGSYISYLVEQGYTQDEAAMAASASSVLLFVVSFLWALFLPLSYHALKCARDRLLDGWIVSCLIIIVVQVILFGIALSLGYIIGPVYLVYCLVRMAILKKRAKKAADFAPAVGTAP